MTSILNFKDFRNYLESTDTKKGCLVDTSILFSLIYPLDIFNEQAEDAFKILAEFDVPIYTNVNIRLEFIELYRRVIVPEALIDLLEDSGENLHPMLLQKLKSLRTRYRNAQKEEKSFKLSDYEIKKFRELFLNYSENQDTGWQEFCESYLSGAIQNAWDQTVDGWNLNFLSLRATEAHPLIEKEVSWEGMVSLVEKFGIGTSDAMILNLFQCSKLDTLITTDTDLVYAFNRSNVADKKLFTPLQIQI